MKGELAVIRYSTCCLTWAQSDHQTAWNRCLGCAIWNLLMDETTSVGRQGSPGGTGSRFSAGKQNGAWKELSRGVASLLTAYLARYSTRVPHLCLRTDSQPGRLWRWSLADRETPRYPRFQVSGQASSWCGYIWAGLMRFHAESK